MKKFQLSVYIGKKLIYQSIIILDREEYDACLQSILKAQVCFLGDEVENVALKVYGKMKFLKNLDKWRDISVEELVTKYPDIAVAAQIQQNVHSTLFVGFPGFVHKEKIVGAKEEHIVCELESYSWQCRPLPVSFKV